MLRSSSSRCVLLDGLANHKLTRTVRQDEVAHLRHYLSNQPAPSTTEPITLPPPLLSLLLPHINNAQRAATVTGASGTGSTTSSVNTALLQRAKLLQEENDELYELLKHGEVSKINEEVRALRRVVQKLETALKGKTSFPIVRVVAHCTIAYRVAQSHCVPLVRSPRSRRVTQTLTFNLTGRNLTSQTQPYYPPPQRLEVVRHQNSLSVHPMRNGRVALLRMAFTRPPNLPSPYRLARELPKSLA